MRQVLYILGELEDTDLQWLVDAGDSHHVEADASIIEEGVPAESLFIVIDGEFAVMKGGMELARLGAGEVVGDMSLLDSRLPTATVTATMGSAVFAIPQSTLRSKLDSDRQFAAGFYRALCIFLANRLARTNALSASSSDSPPEEEEGMPAGMLDNISLAGARFDWFLQRVRVG